MAGLLLAHLHLPTLACTSWPTQPPCEPLLSLHLQPQAFLPTGGSHLSPPPAPHSNCHCIPRLPLVSLPGSCLHAPLNNPSGNSPHCSSNRDQTPEHICKVLPPPCSSSAHKLLLFLHSPAPRPTFQLPDSPSSLCHGPLHWSAPLPEMLSCGLGLFSPCPR